MHTIGGLEKMGCQKAAETLGNFELDGITHKPTTFVDNRETKNMTRLFCLLALTIAFVSLQTFAQTTQVLGKKIQQIVSTKQATVGVAIVGDDGRDTVSLNGDGHYPMQSVFKFHIALAVLSQIDAGKFSLDQKVEILKADLLPDLYSPLREDYPSGAILPISKILEYTVSSSDNVGCEVLLRLVGGPKAVEDYFLKNQIEDVSIKFNEVEQQANWDLQFQNWTTPKAANATLVRFYDNKKNLLSEKSYAFIWKIMRETETGAGRIKGALPKGTIVAHKTGSSGANKAGVTAAVNDIGIVFLPNGHYFFISVFVTNSTEDADTNEKIIAEIARAAWDYFSTKPL
jgi:beta-lactamase class A/beta-lactamase class A VEB